MRRAFTLVELVLVLAVTSTLLGITVPTLFRLLDAIEVESAATQIVSAHQKARVLALSRGQVLKLSIQTDRILILPRNGMIPLWSGAGPRASGVTLEGPARQFTFSPQGFTLGLSNASLSLMRGNSRRTVVVSRLGRVRIVR
jgi:prepilin-type N-terminal cleavage/methylation domain-containing protein